MSHDNGIIGSWNSSPKQRPGETFGLPVAFGLEATGGNKANTDCKFIRFACFGRPFIGWRIHDSMTNPLSLPGSHFPNETKGFPSGGKEHPSRGHTR
jgi:hypothetical protein